MKNARKEQKSTAARHAATKCLCLAVATDFKPILTEIKQLVDTGAEKQNIISLIDRLLGLIAQMEKYGKPENK